MTAPEPIPTDELVARARDHAAWLLDRFKGIDSTDVLLTALADHLEFLAALADSRLEKVLSLVEQVERLRRWEPVGRLVEVMEVGSSLWLEQREDDWICEVELPTLIGVRAAETAHEALAALAAALGVDVAS